MTDLESVCPNCKKVFPVYRDGGRVERKYCSKKCWREFAARSKQENERKVRERRERHKILSESLVPQERCAKCIYHLKYGYLYHCGYFLKTGELRTTKHPEGLTSTCYEFEPRKRRSENNDR